MTGTVEYAPGFFSAIAGDRRDIFYLASSVLVPIIEAATNLADHPPQVIAAYAELNTFVSAFEEDHSDDAVDRAVAAVERLFELEEIGTLTRLHHYEGAKDGVLVPFRDAVSLHIRRWNDRSIDLNLTSVFPAPGPG